MKRTTWILAASLLMTACSGGTQPGDAGDASSNTDVTTDTNGTDVQGNDVQGSDVQGTDASDATMGTDVQRNDVVTTTDVATDTPSSDGQVCESCVAGQVTFGDVGGRVAFRDTAAIDPCRTFRYTRMTFRGSPPPPDMVCMNEIPMCGSSDTVDMGDVIAALNNSEFRAALMAGGVYGCDSRPGDGQVFEITVDGRTIDVGGPDCTSCSFGGGACRPIPAGVAATAAVLRALRAQQLARPTCDTTFPP